MYLNKKGQQQTKIVNIILKPLIGNNHTIIIMNKKIKETINIFIINY